MPSGSRRWAAKRPLAASELRPACANQDRADKIRENRPRDGSQRGQQQIRVAKAGALAFPLFTRWRFGEALIHRREGATCLRGERLKHTIPNLHKRRTRAPLGATRQNAYL